MPNAHDGYIALISGVTNEEAHHPNFIAWTLKVGLSFVEWAYRNVSGITFGVRMEMPRGGWDMKIGSAARFQIEPRVNVVALCKQASPK